MRVNSVLMPGFCSPVFSICSLPRNGREEFVGYDIFNFTAHGLGVRITVEWQCISVQLHSCITTQLHNVQLHSCIEDSRTLLHSGPLKQKWRGGKTRESSLLTCHSAKLFCEVACEPSMAEGSKEELRVQPFSRFPLQGAHHAFLKG